MHNRIKKIRSNEKLSQNKFGECLGITRDMVSNIEYGRVEPKPLFINHLCEMFNVNKEWLLTGEGEMYKPEPKINELEYLMGKFSINAEEDETRTKIIKALLKLDDNGWRVIEGLVDDILKDV